MYVIFEPNEWYSRGYRNGYSWMYFPNVHTPHEDAKWAAYWEGYEAGYDDRGMDLEAKLFNEGRGE